MKDLENNAINGSMYDKSKESLKIVHEIKKQEPTELVYDGNIKIYPGQKCFELDATTGIIKLAEIEKTFVHADQDPNKPLEILHRVIKKKHCFYVAALSFKKAEAKFLKIKDQVLKNLNNKM